MRRQSHFVDALFRFVGLMVPPAVEIADCFYLCGMNKPNSLIHESSPYLLQHAYNPVRWYPWTEDVLQMARKQDKMLIISIGYSACHWCHVMEREVFENEDAAVWMNRNFICIKVDREERPDVDMVYMKAVQLMNGQGGWPLNCFALPDGRPVYGGTYFPLERWIEVMRNLTEMFLAQRTKMEEYATRLTSGVNAEDILPVSNSSEKGKDILYDMVLRWKDRLDYEEGGANRAPKFPLPDNYIFLLRYATLCRDEELLTQVHLTLKKMCRGGLYDQLGGGFSRYSTDMEWKVPHFEKMLYDNALLIQLYAEAYRASPEPEYKEVVEGCISFCVRELKDASGLYYSALDADSEGEEGKYYVWKKAEIDEVLKTDSEWFCRYFGITATGNWEKGENILVRKHSPTEFALLQGETEASFNKQLKHCLERLHRRRDERTRPGTDDKCLTAWNAQLISGFCAAFDALGKQEYLSEAMAIFGAMKKHLVLPDYRILHTFKKGHTKISGFLDDYAFTCRALLDLYYSSGDEVFFDEALRIVNVAIELFDDPAGGLFFYKSKEDPALIATGKEWQDNVIPSSNAVIAKVLFELGTLGYLPQFNVRAEALLACVQGSMTAYGSAYSHWAQLMLHLNFPYYQFVFSGDQAIQELPAFRKQYLPNHILLLKRKERSTIKFLEGKDSGIYVCKDKTCSLPFRQWDEVQKEFSFEV